MVYLGLLGSTKWRFFFLRTKGAGLSLRSGSLRADAVAAAVGLLLGEGQFRLNAERLRDSFSRRDGEENFRQFVAAVM